MAAPYDARAIANRVLDLADEAGVPISNLGLLKLLFYAHGWYLCYFDRPLVKQPFEAWKHGPVVKVVWEAFRPHGKNPIGSRALKFNLIAGAVQIPEKDVDEKDVEFLRGIFVWYSRYSAIELSNMSHQEGGVWDRLWNPQVPTGRLAMRIGNEEIRENFLELIGQFKGDSVLRRRFDERDGNARSRKPF